MINYTAFDTKYSLKTVALYSWRERLSKTGRIIVILAIIFYVLFTFPFILAIIRQATMWVSSDLGGIALILPRLIPLIVIIAIPAVVVFLTISNEKRTLRIKKFCTDNQFDFQPNGGSGGKKGSLFNRGHSRSVSNKISGVYSDCDFSVYDYRYSEGTGKHRRTYNFGVAEMTLKRQFPHVLVDNKRDGSVGGLEFDRSQILELEGDFNNFFTVYGPKEYEIEVLQVLSPSVMSSMLDMHESFDIEIIGDKMFIYNRGMSKKPTFQAIFNAMDKLSTSTKSVQSTFTMPQQIGDNKPILKRSIWPTVITVVFLLLYVILQIVT